MTQVTFRQPDGHHDTLNIDAQTSVMRAAITQGIDGIIGECGGQAMCATCHVYVVRASGELPPVSEDEDEMLECTATERTEQSRLSCQLKGLACDVLEVEIPETQL